MVQRSFSMQQGMVDRKVESYFDKAAVSFDSFYDQKRNVLMRWVDKNFRSSIFERFQLTFETLVNLSDKTVMDIGCGSGPYIQEAIHRGCRKLIAIDMAPSMIELAKKRVQKVKRDIDCDFIIGNFPDQCPSEKCDYAIVMGVMDYIANPTSFLKSLAERVSDIAVLSFPSKHWFRTPFRKLRYKLKKCPVYFYDESQIKKLMLTAGFKKVYVTKIPGAGMDYFTCGIVSSLNQ